ncbi:MAG: disulfide bond formation protein B, partial [Candidatus Symbiodolus clandestinus]
TPKRGACLTKRRFWWMIALPPGLLLVIALYLQYAQGLLPCVLCIYQRLALCGCGLAALLASLQPGNPWLRKGALLLCGYSAWNGLRIAWQQRQLQQGEFPWLTCPLVPQFPDWFRLDQWLPQLFQAQGSCHQPAIHWLSFSFPVWLHLIFAGYFLLALGLFSQQLYFVLSKIKKKA